MTVDTETAMRLARTLAAAPEHNRTTADRALIALADEVLRYLWQVIL